MFVLSNLNDVFAKVLNTSITEEAAESLIDDAVLQAGIELRNHLRHTRRVEQELMEHRKKLDDEREAISKGIRENHARQATESIERNRIEHLATGR
jgi:hypothetical protein